MKKKYVKSAMAILLAGVMGMNSMTAFAENMEEIGVEVSASQEEVLLENESVNLEIETIEQGDEIEKNEAECEKEEVGNETQENVTGEMTSAEEKTTVIENATEELESDTAENIVRETVPHEDEEVETETIEGITEEVEKEITEEVTGEIETETEELTEEIATEEELLTEVALDEIDTFQKPTEITYNQNVSPLIVTEIVPAGPSGKRLTYTEVYNNSDATINFGDYTFFYQYPAGGGKVFNTGDFTIESGETIVLWQCDDAKYESGQNVDFFNDYYGTDLVEGEDIFRINYTGIHSSARRGFAFGRDEDSIICYAESNVEGVDIVDTSLKHAVQYSYGGQGSVSYKSEIAKATPGRVENWQVPSALVHYEQEPNLSIQKVEMIQDENDENAEVSVKANVRGNQGIAKGYLYYRQAQRENETFRVIEMKPSEESGCLVGIIPKEELWFDKIEWHVKVTYGKDYYSQSENCVTELNKNENSQIEGPFVITEIVTPPLSGGEYAGNDQFSYVELCNITNTPINMSYYKLFYEYTGTATADKNWELSNPVTIVQPGESIVLWLSNNGNEVADFNKFYGTNLEKGKNIEIINYAGFHEKNYRTLKIGRTANSIFAKASFNEGNKATIDRTGTQSIQYTYPRTKDGSSIIVSTTTKPSPGIVEEWQIPSELVEFGGYEGYPADDGTMPVLTLEGECPQQITEGEELNVTFRVADNMGIVGTKLFYRLDDEKVWNAIVESKRRVSYYYFAKIPANVLYGHDRVEFYVELYNNYRGVQGERYQVGINRLNQVDGVRLNVAQDSAVRGVTTITANNGFDNSDTKIIIDGMEVPTKAVMEDGAFFSLLATDRDSYFKNAITAPYGDDNRQIIDYLVKWASDSDSKMIHIDNKYFTYDKEKDVYAVTLTVWAGDTGTTFEDIYLPEANHEDYTVRNMKLLLANGKEYTPVSIGPDVEETKEKTNLSTEYSAIHKVGDSAGMCPWMDVTFEIPAQEVTAVGYELDTTQMLDGVHSVRAVSGDKEMVVNVKVDNTLPFIQLGIEELEEVSGTLVIDPVIWDEGGIANASILLDEEEITVPYSINVRDMKKGQHTLTVLAEDIAGNFEQKRVAFVVNELNPSIATIDTMEIGQQNAKLKVTLEAENAENVRVTYYKGKTLTVEDGDILVESGEGDVSLMMRSAFSMNPAVAPTGDLPYYLYTISTGELQQGDEIYVNWDGTANYADDSHAIKMYVWNQMDNAWELIGIPSEKGNIEVSFKAENHVMDGKAIVLVQCRAQHSNPKVKSIQEQQESEEQALSAWDGTSRPEKYDFALAWITDTQYYCESWADHFVNQNKWIIENAEEWKIPYVIHTGDIVDEYDMIDQWEIADRAMKMFDEAGIPYGVLAGNHDVAAGRMDYQKYCKYFGKKRFENMPCYGDVYKDNVGHVDLITQNGQDLMLLYMSWDIYTEEIEWMNAMLKKYPDRKAIILLHRYTNVKESNGTYLDYAGQVLQEQVVKKNSNVVAVLNGHYHGSSFETIAFDDDGDGVKERTVYQICTDYQAAFEGGEEYIKFLYFDLQHDKIYMNSYSPLYNDFNFYDTAKYNNYGDGSKGTNVDIFELDVEFDTSEKILECNRFSAGIRTREKIETVEVVNLEARAVWGNLKPATRYTWYTEVENDKGGLVYSDMVSFITKENVKNVDSGKKYSESKDTDSSYKGISSRGEKVEEKQKREAVVVENNVFHNQQIPEQQVPLEQSPQLKESVLKITGEKVSNTEECEMQQVEETVVEDDVVQENVENDEKSEKENSNTEWQESENAEETSIELENEIEKNPVWYLVLLGSIILALVVIGVYMKRKTGKEDK